MIVSTAPLARSHRSPKIIDSSRDSAAKYAIAAAGSCTAVLEPIGARPSTRSRSVRFGYGTKCITMPVANHIANRRQKAIPSQR